MKSRGNGRIHNKGMNFGPGSQTGQTAAHLKPYSTGNRMTLMQKYGKIGKELCRLMKCLSSEMEQEIPLEYPFW